jgi:hypothetical protein
MAGIVGINYLKNKKGNPGIMGFPFKNTEETYRDRKERML